MITRRIALGITLIISLAIVIALVVFLHRPRIPHAEVLTPIRIITISP